MLCVQARHNGFFYYLWMKDNCPRNVAAKKSVNFSVNNRIIRNFAF